MASINPYKIVDDFEKTIAEYCGSKYAVAVESCTAAIFLSLKYLNPLGEITIPKHTYPSVPTSIIHAGAKVAWSDEPWEGEYQLKPWSIWDAALRFKRGMYHGGFQCLSFHIKKHIPIGRGGMILTDDKEAYEWFKLARFDGREEGKSLGETKLDVLGWNMYLTPEQAARGLMLFQMIKDKELPDLKVEEQNYPDLSTFPIYEI